MYRVKARRGYHPLAEAGERSERIVIGNLGLPVGFNEERIGVNFRALERALHNLGIGRLTIKAASDFEKNADVILGDINPDGTATALKVGKARPEMGRLSNSGHGPNAPLGYESVLSINTRAVTQELTGGGKSIRGKNVLTAALSDIIAGELVRGGFKQQLNDIQRRFSTAWVTGGLTIASLVESYATKRLTLPEFFTLSTEFSALANGIYWIGGRRADSHNHGKILFSPAIIQGISPEKFAAAYAILKLRPPLVDRGSDGLG